MASSFATSCDRCTSLGKELNRTLGAASVVPLQRRKNESLTKVNCDGRCCWSAELGKSLKELEALQHADWSRVALSERSTHSDDSVKANDKLDAKLSCHKHKRPIMDKSFFLPLITRVYILAQRERSEQVSRHGKWLGR